jgi:CRISPR system Cascade subunit CasD
MATLLLRLIGPMQSWGSSSRFGERDTGKEPTKSGVLGLVAAAIGIERENWADLKPIAELQMGVRHDRPGMLMRDFHTALAVIRASGKVSDEHALLSERYYLADAAFLVGLTGENRSLLEQIDSALRNPRWPLCLGRRACVPSEPIALPNGIRDSDLHTSFTHEPLIVSYEDLPVKALISWESSDRSGTMRMDQPVSSFAERRFAARFVRSEWINLSTEMNNVAQ